jgi:hypothetical protein
LAQFGEPLGASAQRFTADVSVRCGILAGSEARALLLGSLGSDRTTDWANSKTIFQVLVRPLLPDETTCTDATLS